MAQGNDRQPKKDGQHASGHDETQGDGATDVLPAVSADLLEPIDDFEPVAFEHEDENEEFGDDGTTAIISFHQLSARRLTAAAYLTVLAGPRVGEMMEISDELVIGRGEQAGLRIGSTGISRQHLRLVPDERGLVTLYDLDSSNGTFVNGERVSGRKLSDGDKIQIGSDVVLKFSYADALEQSFQKRMFDAAAKDGLTGVYNRRHLMTCLSDELEYVTEHKMPLSLIMLDLDHFKSINDTYGHPVGDSVLVGLARLLEQQCRTEDVIGRYGGEEFCIVCRGIRGKVGVVVAERVRAAVARSRLCTDVAELRVTLSAGVASIPNASIRDSDGLVLAADKALYEAKKGGRNCVKLAPGS
jgi:two-component system cell cycle response regulator